MTSTKKSAPETLPSTPMQLSRITKTVNRVRHEDAPKTPEARALAGSYRVIHGHIGVVLPEKDWRNPDGSLRPGVPTTANAEVGDEVWLNDVDAANALDAGLIEPLDARPSRVGMVWDPPKVVHNYGYPQARTAGSAR